MRRSFKNSVNSLERTRDITKAEINEAPEDVELENRQTPAADPPATPNVLEQARLGNLDLFQTALESVNQRLDFKAGRAVCCNRTSLHLAAMGGHEEIVDFILNRPGISREVVNAKDCFGYTPLHLAVWHSHENIVRLLTTSSLVLPDRFLAATNEPDDLGEHCGGYTPLHLAAVRGHTAIATLLLRQPCQLEFAYAPVNIYATNWNSETPLDLARKNNFKDLVEVLENSDLNYLQQERARNGMSANAILVGAALVAAAAFGAWLQPPGGLANPDSEAPSPSPSDESTPSLSSVETTCSYFFFVYAASAFLFSMWALVLGTLATFPIPAASLKVEVQLLRRLVRQAQCILVLALVSLMDSFSFAATLVLYKYPAFKYPVIDDVIYYLITFFPFIIHIFVLHYFFSYGFRMREKYGVKKGLIIWFLLTVSGLQFYFVRFLIFLVHMYTYISFEKALIHSIWMSDVKVTKCLV